MCPSCVLDTSCALRRGIRIPILHLETEAQPGEWMETLRVLEGEMWRTATPLANSLQALGPCTLPKSSHLLPWGPRLTVPPCLQLLTNPSWQHLPVRPHCAYASDSPHHMGHIWLHLSTSSPPLSPQGPEQGVYT